MPGTFSVPDLMPRSWPRRRLSRDLHARVAPANVERATPLGRKFMPGERQHIDVVGDYVDGNLAHSLHRVSVEEHVLFMTELADLGDGWRTPISLFAAMIVTRMVLSSIARFRSSRSMRPSAFNREIRDAIAVLLQSLAGVSTALCS